MPGNYTVGYIWSIICLGEWHPALRSFAPANLTRVSWSPKHGMFTPRRGSVSIAAGEIWYAGWSSFDEAHGCGGTEGSGWGPLGYRTKSCCRVNLVGTFFKSIQHIHTIWILLLIFHYNWHGNDFRFNRHFLLLKTRGCLRHILVDGCKCCKAFF